MVLLTATLAGCGAEIDRHGHVFMDIDLATIQPGMSKEQVASTLGSPDTTSTIGGDAFYYISTTQKSYAFFKPWEIDRKVVAVYFNGQSSVDYVAQYGLKDGIVVRYAKDETPARGKDSACSSSSSATSRSARYSKTKSRALPAPYRWVAVPELRKRPSSRSAPFYWWASTASSGNTTILVILIIGFTAGPAVSL